MRWKIKRNMVPDLTAIALMAFIVWIMMDLLDRKNLVQLPGICQTPYMILFAIIAAVGISFYVVWRLNMFKREKTIHKAILENMQESVLAFDAKGKVVYCNNHFLKVFPDVRKVSKENWTEFFGLHTLDGRKLALEEYPSYRSLRGEVIEQEHLLVLSNAVIDFYISFSASPIYGIDKRIIGAVICYQDNTARKKAELSLEGSVRLYNSIADNMHDLLVIADAKGFIDFASRSYETLLGRDPNKLKGMHVLDVVPPLHRERLMPLFLKVTKEKQFVVFEHDIMTADDDARHFHVHASPILNQYGDLERILVVSREFTEEKTITDQLRKKERDLERAQQIAETGNWELNLQTKVAQGSKELYRILEIEGQEQQGVQLESFYNLIHPEDRTEFNHLITLMRERHEGFDLEVRLLMLNGQVKYVHIQGEFLEEDDGIANNCIGIMRNVTAWKLSEQELDQTRLRLEQVLNQLDVVLWSRDYRTKEWGYLSPGIERVFGVTRQDEIQGRDLFFDLVYPPDLPVIQDAVRDMANHRDGIMMEFRIFHNRTGQIRWIQTSSTPVFDTQDQLVSIYGISVDVTDRKRAEAMKRSQYEILKELVWGKPLQEILEKLVAKAKEDISANEASILLFEQEERYPYLHVHTFGLPPGMDQPFSFDGPILQSSKEQRAIWVENMDQLTVVSASQFQVEMKAHGIRAGWFTPIISAKNGKLLGVFSLFFEEIGLPRANDPELIEGFLQLAALAIEQTHSEQEIQTLAFFDPLTGLGNRRHLMNELNRNIELYGREGGGFGLLYIDLDQFKFVNDSLGHDAGDEILIQIGKRLKRLGTELVLARLGGDEFALLMPGIENEQQCYRMARNVMNIINEPFSISGHEFRLTGSIGISQFPEHGMDANLLLKHADNAMYQAKAAGRNRYFGFDAKLDSKAYQRFVLMSELDRALAGQEFLLFYQPRVELESTSVKGVEALIRWRHPQHGFIPPGEFIPLAEETGFIATLGEWVLWEACRQAKEWAEEESLFLRVAVNVAAQQFWDPGFVSMVRRTLQETGLEAQWLELEITESALMSDQERMVNVLSELRELGVYVSIDDFGTGYSSLSYLKRFKVNTLKIDRSFIQDLPDDLEDAAITTTIITLARSLGLQVTAEGAERSEQVEFLRMQGCDSIQGYYYGKPMPPDELLAFMRNQQA
ncbi:diguanylate cyclase (GGDEF)-like protein/PAS domain S-box-containing protein [Paenibacillus phyllosphaerae]|uniref:Diguanylate cyclase (GGDEF)-like protein/PAS domain S-box-containing protein n=1 Tax=Paenibacillus phyllosphaerae TaxID=274593 RepID=A0A7W5B5J0_9BACL|nr:EAL domain-containing protein [Paenibacillus phyllosphaerae]MBB3114787.1 diguanylate cyclase (GGDEF)-like protein/PAS domain S-box-containing protein [Paenibacillus phyllosphaerae]